MGDEAKTFSQEDVNRIVAEERRKEQAKYGDYDAMKAAAAKLAELENKGKTDLEKVQSERDAYKSQAEKAEAALKGRDLQIRIAQVAGVMGAVDAYDPNFALACQGLDPNGTGVEEQIKAQVEGLRKSKPYLFRAGTQPVASFNPPGGSGSATKSDIQRIQELQQKTGMTPF